MDTNELGPRARKYEGGFVWQIHQVLQTAAFAVHPTPIEDLDLCAVVHEHDRRRVVRDATTTVRADVREERKPCRLDLGDLDPRRHSMGLQDPVLHDEA